MTSKLTSNRIAKVQALKRMFIKIYNILHLPYSEIDKIPMNFLLDSEIRLERYAPQEKESERYITQSYISVKHHDGTAETSQKNSISLNGKFKEVFNNENDFGG